MCAQSKLDFVFGCRSPDSRFAWDGALVMVKVRGSNDIVASVFQNGMDYIGHPKTYEEALATYNEHLSRQWIPMDVADLVKTAIDMDQVDEHTLLLP